LEVRCVIGVQFDGPVLADLYFSSIIVEVEVSVEYCNLHLRQIHRGPQLNGMLEAKLLAGEQQTELLMALVTEINVCGAALDLNRSSLLSRREQN
jgi:hypothetical protein